MGEQLWPADKVERWPIDKLTPYARNSRTHSAAQIDQIAASIKEWGWTTPALVDESGTLIAGHARVLAAHKLKITHVPVMTAVGWSEAKKRAYVIADNKLALNAEWDQEMLVQELGDLFADGFDLGMTGFDASEIELLLHGSAPGEGLTDPDDVPAAPVDPVSVPGDIWVLGRHFLAVGDCREPNTVEMALNGVKPHLLVTDPPYGVNYSPDWRSGLDKVKRATGKVENDGQSDWRDAYTLFPGDVAYVWHAGIYADAVAQSLKDCGFVLRSQIIWVKPHFAIGRSDYHWQHEPCWYAVRSSETGHWAGDRKQSTVWSIDNNTFQGGKRGPEDERTGHGTQKPVECMRRPIENNSSPGQAVYDPFVGSGSTIIACEMTGRACHAIEIHPSWADCSVIRWQNYTGKKAVLRSSGQTYDEVSAARPRARA